MQDDTQQIDDTETPLPAALLAVQVQPWQGDTQAPVRADHLIAECPVALVFNGLSHVVMMATPTHLEAWALGFALSEGVIPDASHALGTEVVSHAQGIEVRMQISTRCFEALKGRRRYLEGRSGCGLCGVDSLAALQMPPVHGKPPQAQPLQTQLGDMQATQAVLAVQKAMAQLPAHQPLNQASGACHAAGWADAQGHLHMVFEDVGRHNALDKLIGHLARQSGRGEDGVVLMSSRASVELVRKCAAMRLGTLATVSAPSSLAVQWAQAQGVRLLGFCRGNSVIQYAP